jgi:antitoxin (DNA-binding transcriptional repressor) of toxin-antitoxin stability system
MIVWSAVLMRASIAAQTCLRYHEPRHVQEAAMTTVSLEEAKLRLAELIALLQAGDDVVITQDERPVARLVKPATDKPGKRRLGTLKGSVKHMAEDFDAPLPWKA